MRKFRLNQRRVAIICAVILVGLSTVTVLRQKGVLFSAGQNGSANAHAEPAKKRATTEPQPKKKVESAAGKTQNSPVLQAKPETSVASASEKKASEPQPEQPKQAAETKQSTANTTAPAAKQTQTAQADNKPVEKTSEKTTDTNTAKETGDTFAYTASAGSSYTLFAREAVSSVVANQQLQASTVQTLQAEVELTNNAGSPLLDVGQAVTISRADVIAALQHAGVKIDAQNASTASVAQSRESDKSRENNAPAKSTQQTQATTASADYSATANPGDSYTFHARTAIAKYLQANKQALSPEQRAAAESYIVSAAGAPSLEVGQTVVINAKTIADAVARASSLSASEQAAWSQWATP